MKTWTWKELHDAQLVRLRIEPDPEGLEEGAERRLTEFRMLPGHEWTWADSVGDCYPGCTYYDADLQQSAVNAYHSSLERLRRVLD